MGYIFGLILLSVVVSLSTRLVIAVEIKFCPLMADFFVLFFAVKHDTCVVPDFVLGGGEVKESQRLEKKWMLYPEKTFFFLCFFLSRVGWRGGGVTASLSFGAFTLARPVCICLPRRAAVD